LAIVVLQGHGEGPADSRRRILQEGAKDGDTRKQALPDSKLSTGAQRSGLEQVNASQDAAAKFMKIFPKVLLDLSKRVQEYASCGLE